MTGVLRGIARTLFILIVVAAVGIGSFIGISLVYFSRELPNHKQLAEYVPAIGTKVYAGDSAFMAEFANEHRIVVPISLALIALLSGSFRLYLILLTVSEMLLSARFLRLSSDPVDGHLEAGRRGFIAAGLGSILLLALYGFVRWGSPNEF